MTDLITQLAELHIAAIDARDGYTEARDAAGEEPLSRLFDSMAKLHDGHSSELAARLLASGQQPAEDGSFMTTVNRTIMNVRSWLGALDDSVLPGLIDGEERNIAAYDKSLSGRGLDAADRAMLLRHRQDLVTQVSLMQARQMNAPA